MTRAALETFSHRFRPASAGPRRHQRTLGRLATILLLDLLLGLPLFLSGCSSGNEAEPVPVVTVQTAPVLKTTLKKWVTAEGVLYPLHQAIIIPKVSSPIQQFFVNRGDRVHKGELLALLQNQDLKALTVENRGLYQQAQADYQTALQATLPQQMQQAQLDVTAAQRNLDAQQKIYNSRKVLFQQGAIARRDLETSGVSLVQARNQYQIAVKHLRALEAVGNKAQRQAATGQLVAARGRYEGAQAQLAYTEIRSPLNGVVTERPLYPGEQAGPGAPLITVMDLSKVIARIHIDPHLAAEMHPGQAAVMDSPEGVEVPAQVMLVSPAVDPGGTTIEVWVEAENPRLLLHAGATAEVRVLVRTVPGAIVIPAQALLTTPDGGDVVMLAEPDGKAHQVSVKPGIQAGQQVEILKGVKPGEQVITVGAYGLPDGTKLRVANGTAAPAAAGGQS